MKIIFFEHLEKCLSYHVKGTVYIHFRNWPEVILELKILDYFLVPQKRIGIWSKCPFTKGQPDLEIPFKDYFFNANTKTHPAEKYEYSDEIKQACQVEMESVESHWHVKKKNQVYK